MAEKFWIALVVTAVLALADTALGDTCSGKDLALSNRFECPRPGDPHDASFCCDEISESARCCSIDDPGFIGSLGRLLGIVIAVGIILFIVIGCVCCCCCPFCLIAKKRKQRGQDIRPASQNQAVLISQHEPQQQPYLPPGQPGYMPQQQPYSALQKQPYFPPGAAAGSSEGFAAPPPPYPGTTQEQLPPRTSKEYHQNQPAFNPNY